MIRWQCEDFEGNGDFILLMDVGGRFRFPSLMYNLLQPY